MIIDCHGHYTTAPKALENWRNQQIAGIQHPAAKPKVADLKISDDELRESIETNQLKLIKERGADITIFSPRASAMAPHVGDQQVASDWAFHCNNLIYRVTQLFPDTFIGVCMLPQSPKADLKASIGELRRCVTELDSQELNRAKAFSRVGMGRCQGRFCGHAAAEIVAQRCAIPVEQVGRLRSQAPVKPLMMNTSEVKA